MKLKKKTSKKNQKIYLVKIKFIFIDFKADYDVCHLPVKESDNNDNNSSKKKLT